MLQLYMARQSYVRAKVSSFAWSASKESGHESAALKAECCSYYNLSHKISRKTCGVAIIMCGLSGSGKSTEAQRLAFVLSKLRSGQPLASSWFSSLPAITLRSDCVRKHLFDIPLDKKAPESIYSPQASSAVYAELEKRGCAAVAEGWTVLFDAKFDTVQQRLSLLRACQNIGAAVAIVHVFAPVDVRKRNNVPAARRILTFHFQVLIERIESRGRSVSDATPQLLASQAARFEAISCEERPFAVTIDTAAAAAVPTEHIDNQLWRILQTQPRAEM